MYDINLSRIFNVEQRFFNAKILNHMIRTWLVGVMRVVERFLHKSPLKTNYSVIIGVEDERRTNTSTFLDTFLM